MSKTVVKGNKLPKPTKERPSEKPKAVASDKNPGIRLLDIHIMDTLAQEQLMSTLRKHIPANRPVTFLCIGTDRSTGDSFGPMVGTFLQQKGMNNVIGTIEYPAHGTNLDNRISEISEGNFVVAIDACLGKPDNIGRFSIIKGSLSPGAGVGKDLTNVGDLSITYVVNSGGYLKYLVLQNTRLNTIWQGAEMLSEAIRVAISRELLSNIGNRRYV